MSIADNRSKGYPQIEIFIRIRRVNCVDIAPKIIVGYVGIAAHSQRTPSRSIDDVLEE